jgi:hypothetical protein
MLIIRRRESRCSTLFNGKSLKLVRNDNFNREKYAHHLITVGLSKWAKSRNILIPMGGERENYGPPAEAGSDQAIASFAFDILFGDVSTVKQKLWKAGVRVENNDTEQSKIQGIHIDEAANVIIDAFVRCYSSLKGGRLSQAEKFILVFIKETPIGDLSMLTVHKCKSIIRYFSGAHSDNNGEDPFSDLEAAVLQHPE